MHRIFFILSVVLFLSFVFVHASRIARWVRKLLGLTHTISNEIVVSSYGDVRIPISSHDVISVDVHFADDSSVPCDPSEDDDELTFFIHPSHDIDGSCKTELVIGWNVSGVRTIVWSVTY